MNISLPLTLAARLALILDGLARAVAARSARGPSWLGAHEALADALIILIWERVKRTERRVLGLLARFQAGRLRVAAEGPQVTRSGAGGGRVEGRPGGRAPVCVPRHFGWVLALVPCQAAGFAAQLRLALAEPEMVALLRASAQARRVLAPLCRMIGIEAELLSPPPARPMDAAEVAAVAARVATDEVWARAYNLGVVRHAGLGAGPPGNGGWRFGEPP